jgi:3'(2'), 5'-bisphosphate nucleotidase
VPNPEAAERQRASEVATDAVRRAARVCRRVQDELGEGDSRRKADRSPVTIADFAAQALICASLEQEFPDQVVVGEESAEALRHDDDLRERVVALVAGALPEPVDAERVLAWIDRGTAERPEAGRFWTVDPIDGTKGFLRGQQYAVALARIEGDQVELGVLGCPKLESDGRVGVIVRAERGQGALCLPLEGEAEPRPTSARPLEDPRELRLVESVEPSHSSHAATRRIADRLGVRAASLRLDSQAKYAAVALGLADVYLRLPGRSTWREFIWDHAAGSLVVEEAGGAVSDARGRALDFGEGRWLRDCRGVVAAPQGLHAAVVSAASEEVARRLG